MALSEQDINKLMGIVLERMATLPSLKTRVVLFEKYKHPSVGYASYLNEEYEEIQEDDIFYQWYGPRRRIGDLDAVLEWHDDQGRLHNTNDMPARISINRIEFIKMEWYQHGVPFRKQNFYNNITIKNHFQYTTAAKSVKHTTELQWLNQHGQLHSFNGLPAKITEDSVEWYWNGENCRMNYDNDLPCIISEKRGMTFRRHKNDAPHTISMPLAMRDYGPLCLKNLHLYERYVSWPIRKVLTL